MAENHRVLFKNFFLANGIHLSNKTMRSCDVNKIHSHLWSGHGLTNAHFVGRAVVIEEQGCKASGSLLPDWEDMQSKCKSQKNLVNDNNYLKSLT